MNHLATRLGDPFTEEILRNYLIATVREMGTTTVRTAYSTCFSEGEDFTCALFDAEGRLLAQAAGLPVHVGGLGRAIEHFRTKWASFEPGDIVLHNDPYTGGSHQADGTVFRPIFHGPVLLGFAANRGHWTDIGGMSPGGWSGTARHIVQEALRIPAVKLYEGGRLREDVRDLIVSNVRLSHQLLGDLQAQIASTITAERRIEYLVEKYGIDVVLASFDAAREYSRRRFIDALRTIPDGEASVRELYMEDDGEGRGPYYVTVKVTKSETGFVVDYAGTDPQADATVNCSEGCTRAATYAALIAVADPDVPVNQGLLDLIEVRAPLGSLINPEYPAPCFAGTGDPVHRLSEIMQLALAQFVPDRVMASSYATGNNLTGWGYRSSTKEEFLWYVFESGGCGARKSRDGNSVEFFLMGNCKNESMEVWEQRYPVRFRSYGMITDSAGPGRQRGGLGSARRIELIEPTSLTANADRHRIAGPGFFGGQSGQTNGFFIERDGERHSFTELFGTLSPSKFSNVQAMTGDVLVVQQGGGAGYGDPVDRDERAVARDVRLGYVSVAAARSQYGVVCNEDGDLDAGTTERLRDGMRLAREASAPVERMHHG